ncbi:MAG: hypothetical protein U9Q69_01025 [Nanoarchaeota archaeon]|nr:hypothetical protein [Nanoarchaeota archaeon]
MLQAKEVEKQYKELLKSKAVKEGSSIISHLKWQKAVNDLALAEGLFEISTSEKIKDSLGIDYRWTNYYKTKIDKR